MAQLSKENCSRYFTESRSCPWRPRLIGDVNSISLLSRDLSNWSNLALFHLSKEKKQAVRYVNCDFQAGVNVFISRISWWQFSMTSHPMVDCTGLHSSTLIVRYQLAFKTLSELYRHFLLVEFMAKRWEKDTAFERQRCQRETAFEWLTNYNFAHVDNTHSRESDRLKWTTAHERGHRGRSRRIMLYAFISSASANYQRTFRSFFAA